MQLAYRYADFTLLGLLASFDVPFNPDPLTPSSHLLLVDLTYYIVLYVHLVSNI